MKGYDSPKEGERKERRIEKREKDKGVNILLWR